MAFGCVSTPALQPQTALSMSSPELVLLRGEQLPFSLAYILGQPSENSTRFEDFVFSLNKPFESCPQR